MSFTKRRFNQEKILRAYSEGSANGIEKLMGKIDVYIYEDDFSSKVIGNWTIDRESSINLIKDVLRISDEASGNNGLFPNKG